MKRTLIAFAMATLVVGTGFAQLRPNNQDGVNVFETQKQDSYSSDFKVEFGGGFTQSWQALKNVINTAPTLPVVDIQPGFNLAEANLATNVYLAEGVTLNMELYLSARHHNETWVKGGFIQFDRLPFLKSQIVDDIMKYTTIKVGHMEINYGDAHFRRSDGGNSIFNPFIENNIMDAFDTEIGGEILYQRSGFLGMIGASNGSIKGDVTTPNSPVSVYGKLGYDKQINDDFRVRLTGSIYNAPGGVRGTLFGGDRTGSHYYYALHDLAQYKADAKAGFTTGRYNPGFSGKFTSVAGNLFLQYKGLESFTTVENVGDTVNNAMQFATELVYRFGGSKQFFVGAKYNTVSGTDSKSKEASISRITGSAGWFVTKNVLAKAEYVNQTYGNVAAFASPLKNNGFKGVVFEAVVGF